MSYIYLVRENSKEPLLEVNDVGVVTSVEGETLNVRFLREHVEIVTEKLDVEYFEVSETGDEYDYKICDRCFKHLSTSDDFENNRIKKGGKITKRPSCRDCRKHKNGKPISTADRNEWNKTKPVHYTSFTCPICEKRTIAGISKVVLDHCHKTGSVRGWVCESCNTGIGRFDDDPEIVQRAIKWLSK